MVDMMSTGDAMSAVDPVVRRLFVAIRPPAQVTTELGRLVDSLATEVGPAVRWSPPGGYHVTLRYIGDAAVDPVRRALDRVLPVTEITVELGPALIELGSAIVAPAAGAEDVANLVGEAVDGFGQPQPDRPFLGHLTIGRWRRGQTTGGLVGRPVSGRFTTGTVELLASARQPSGDGVSNYETLWSWSSGTGQA